MRTYRKIPTKIIIDGDTEAGKLLIREGLSELMQLENALSFQSLPQGRRYVNRGYAVFEVAYFFGRSFLRILIPGKGGKKKGLPQKCFCNCDFAQGYILRESGGSLEYPDINRRYDVEVCNNKDRYVQYLYCLPSDFLNYEQLAVDLQLDSVTGLPVIVFLDKMRPIVGEGSCCTQTPTGPTACRPGAFSVPTGDENPVYRLVPVRSTAYSKWRPDYGK